MQECEEEMKNESNFPAITDQVMPLTEQLNDRANTNAQRKQTTPIHFVFKYLSLSFTQSLQPPRHSSHFHPTFYPPLPCQPFFLPFAQMPLSIRVPQASILIPFQSPCANAHTCEHKDPAPVFSILVDGIITYFLLKKNFQVNQELILQLAKSN